jgi:hypothetical protein
LIFNGLTFLMYKKCTKNLKLIFVVKLCKVLRSHIYEI